MLNIINETTKPYMVLKTDSSNENLLNMQNVYGNYVKNHNSKSYMKDTRDSSYNNLLTETE